MTDFLTASELYRITGTRKPAEQARLLRSQGFNPWIHPRTGVPILYRDVFKSKQIGDTKAGFTMDLDAISA